MGAVNYPIRRQAEQWLMDQVQPVSTVGGQFLWNALKDFGITGEHVQQLRSAGLFEAGQAIRKKVKQGLFRAEAVSSDQLLELLLFSDIPLDADWCMGILLGLGCLRVDGRVPREPSDAQAILDLQTVAQRTQHSSCDVGELSSDESVRAMQDFVRAVYITWQQDSRLLRSA
jgi:hypothetical protein